MPVYVYRNLKTDETFEISQKMTEPALTEHPETGDPVKRLIQPVGIAFKGSGFYVTDSRKESSKPAAKADVADGTKADTKTEAKSDTKTETAAPKAESKKEGGSSPAPSKSDSK